MDAKTAAMVKEWLASYGGDAEATACFIRDTIQCGIKQARRMIVEASKVAA